MGDPPVLPSSLPPCWHSPHSGAEEVLAPVSHTVCARPPADEGPSSRLRSQKRFVLSCRLWSRCGHAAAAAAAVSHRELAWRIALERMNQRGNHHGVVCDGGVCVCACPREVVCSAGCRAQEEADFGGGRGRRKGVFMCACVCLDETKMSWCWLGVSLCLRVC